MNEAKNELNMSAGCAPTDMNGKPIEVGDWVTVHQDDGKSVGVVLEANTDSPTKNEHGHWIDIDRGEGTEGMMSYICELSPA